MRLTPPESRPPCSVGMGSVHQGGRPYYRPHPRPHRCNPTLPPEWQEVEGGWKAGCREVASGASTRDRNLHASWWWVAVDPHCGEAEREDPTPTSRGGCAEECRSEIRDENLPTAWLKVVRAASSSAGARWRIGRSRHTALLATAMRLPRSSTSFERPCGSSCAAPVRHATWFQTCCPSRSLEALLRP